jgi:endonuclease YncB( thermonuclease family)
MKYFIQYIAFALLGAASTLRAPVTMPNDARWATVIDTIDGDTIDVLEQLDVEHFRRVHVRLRRINCPEKNTPAGVDAKKYTAARLTPNSQVVLNDLKADKYYRLDAEVWYNDRGAWTSLNQELLDTGHAVPFIGE